MERLTAIRKRSRIDIENLRSESFVIKGYFTIVLSTPGKVNTNRSASRTRNAAHSPLLLIRVLRSASFGAERMSTGHPASLCAEGAVAGYGD